MSTSDQTKDQIIDSLTGHEEWAISRNFGAIIGDLVDDFTMLHRALIFVVKKREGENEDDARNAALDLPLSDVMEFFALESVESGKDESESGPTLTPSPVGVPEPDEVLTTI